MGEITDAVIKDLTLMDDDVADSSDIVSQAGTTLKEEREGTILSSSIEGRKRFVQSRLFLKYIQVDFEFFTNSDHTYKG
jgi:hypothetical protein